MTKLTKEEAEALVKEFDSDLQPRVRELHLRGDVVFFRNEMLDSSQRGLLSAMVVGPTCTYKTVQECEGNHLNDLPSQRQYAFAYWPKED